MRARPAGLVTFTVLLAMTLSPSFAGPPDAELVKVANWLVGAFAEQPSRAGAGAANQEMSQPASLMIRALQDPVVFGDGLYAYVQLTTQPNGKGDAWQRVFRLKKAGSRVRVEVLRIDGRVVSMLSSDPQMLNNLAPADLTKENGCDMTLDPRGDEYFAATDPRSCASNDKESAERLAGIQVSKDRVVLLQRVAGAAGVKRYEFHRAPQ